MALKEPKRTATPTQKRLFRFIQENGWSYEEAAPVFGFGSRQGLHEWLMKDFKRHSPVEDRINEELDRQGALYEDEDPEEASDEFDDMLDGLE